MMETTASWLADGVDKIAELTKAANTVKPEFVKLPDEKPGTYGIVMPAPAGGSIDKQFQQVLAGPGWHREKLATPKELSAFIKSLKDRGIAPTDGVILVDREAAKYFYSFNDRRDVATCPLIVSTPWAWLSAPTRQLSQRDLIRALRITFDGCLPTGSSLVSVFRNLKFTNNGTAEANIQRGNEALGRRVMNEVVGTTDLPEDVILSVPVYENYPKRVSVRVAIEVIADAGQFELIAYPNELENGRQETLNAIRDDVAFDSDVPAFLGAIDKQ
jgi:hypothetical protein